VGLEKSEKGGVRGGAGQLRLPNHFKRFPTLEKKEGKGGQFQQRSDGRGGSQRRQSSKFLGEFVKRRGRTEERKSSPARGKTSLSLSSRVLENRGAYVLSRKSSDIAIHKMVTRGDVLISKKQKKNEERRELKGAGPKGSSKRRIPSE